MEKQKSLVDLIDSLGDIGEINLVLKSLETSPLEMWVLKSCILNKSGISTRIPLPDILIGLSIELRLIKLKQSKNREIVYLTNYGKELIKDSYVWDDRFSDFQSRYLFSRIIVKTELLNDIFNVINLLNKDKNNNLWISCRDKRIDSSADRMLRLFQQLNFADFNDGNIFIHNEKAEWLINVIGYGLTIDESTLMKILESCREVGSLAEELVMNYEKKRLCDCGREDLSSLVVRISKVNVSAGYDILSFNCDSPVSNPNRFVEVKGTSASEIAFFISRNELDKAKELQDNYWIYCVLNTKQESLRKIKTIKNPYKTFFSTKNYAIEPVLWRVRSNNLG